MDERLDPARLSITGLVDVVAARRRGLDMALALGFSPADANQIAVAVSELSRHLVFQGGGTLTLIAQVTGKKGIKIVAQDRGQGIENVEAVLAGRCPPPSTLGRGVLEIRPIIDDFEMNSVVGGGTTIRAAKWVR